MAALGHPQPRRVTHGDCTVVTQQLAQGPAWAVAWARRGSAFFISAETAPDAASAGERALGALRTNIQMVVDANARALQSWAKVVKLLGDGCPGEQE